LTSLHLSTERDIRLNAAAYKKQKFSLEEEAKNINKGMKALEKRKQQCTQVLERRRQRQQQQQQHHQQQQQQQQQRHQEGSKQEQEQEAAFENSHPL
jgi:Ca-activated chloride channel family protein